MLKAVLFDFGNVLGRFRHETACERLAVYTKTSSEHLYRELCVGPCATARQIGALSPEAFYEMVKGEYDLSRDCTFELFCEIWGDIFSPAPAEIIDIVSRVRVRRCIASNTEALHWPYVAPLPIIALFQEGDIFRSYKVGHEKPNQEFFKYILERLGCGAEEVFFIDDVEANVESFRQMGGRGEVFDLRQHSPSDLEAMLQAVGTLEM